MYIQEVNFIRPYIPQDCSFALPNTKENTLFFLKTKAFLNSSEILMYFGLKCIIGSLGQKQIENCKTNLLSDSQGKIKHLRRSLETSSFKVRILSSFKVRRLNFGPKKHWKTESKTFFFFELTDQQLLCYVIIILNQVRINLMLNSEIKFYLFKNILASIKW